MASKSSDSSTIRSVSNITVVNIPVVPMRECILATTPILLSNRIGGQLGDLQTSHNIFSSVASGGGGSKVNFLPLEHQPEQGPSSENNCITITDGESLDSLPSHSPVSNDGLCKVLSNFQQNFETISDAEASNPSLLKIPIINMGSSASNFIDRKVGVINSSVNILDKLQEQSSGLSANTDGSGNSANRPETSLSCGSFNSRPVDCSITSETHTTSNGNYATCKAFRPIKPMLSFTDALKAEVLPSELQHQFCGSPSQEDISIVKCELDSLDSFIENAVITVDDVYEKNCDVEHHHHVITRDVCIGQSPEISPKTKINLCHVRSHQIATDVSLSDSLPAAETHPTIVNKLENDIMCVLCGKDDSLCKITENEVFLDKTGKKVLSLLCSVLCVAHEDLCVQGNAMCESCLKLLQAVDNFRKSLVLKENIIKSLYSKTVKKVRGLFNNREKLNFDDNHNSDAISKTAVSFKDSENSKSIVETDNTFEKKIRREKFPCKLSAEQQVQDRKVDIKSPNVKESKPTLPGARTTGENSVSVMHQKKTRMRKKFSCEQCLKSFLDRRRLVAHAATHDRGFECRVCGRYLTTRVRLATHLFKFHGIGEEKRKIIQCDQCDKAFQTKQGLAYHMNVSHQTGSKYVCPQCEKVFYYHVLYRSHMLFAHGEKKVVCKQCGDRFFTVSKLNTHINAKHINAKTWQCKECCVLFTTGTAYRQHNLLRHHGARFGCDYCNVKCKTKSSLLSHLREHNLHACRVCKELLFSAEQHAQHMVSAHDQAVSKLSKKKLPARVPVQNKRLVRPKTAAESHSKSSRQLAESSSDLGRIDLNEILLNNSYNNSSTLQMFNSGNREKMNSSYIPCSGDKIHSFPFLDPGNELEVSAHSPAITLDNNVSFINVEILNNLPHGEKGNLPPTNDSENGIPLLDGLDHVENMSANLNSIGSFNHVMNSNLTSELTSSVESFPQVSGQNIVVEDLVKQAVGGIDASVPDFSASMSHLDDANLTSTVENLESELRPMPSALGNDVHQMEVSSLQPPVVDMDPSVHELCTVDMEGGVDQLGSSAVPERLGSADIARSSDEIQIPDSDMHSTSPKAIQSSNIWFKENAWAMLKSSSGDENLSSLQNLSNPTMEDLDMSVMAGDIVSENAMGEREGPHLDIDVSDKANEGSLEMLDVEMAD